MLVVLMGRYSLLTENTSNPWTISTTWEWQCYNQSLINRSYLVLSRWHELRWTAIIKFMITWWNRRDTSSTSASFMRLGRSSSGTIPTGNATRTWARWTIRTLCRFHMGIFATNSKTYVNVTELCMWTGRKLHIQGKLPWWWCYSSLERGTSRSRF